MAADVGYPPPPPGPPGIGNMSRSARHPILEKSVFEQLHRNEIIETRPHTLHFGGFQIHQEHVSVLRVINISPSSLRLAIIGPSTAYFRISYDKKGLLAPGMSEEIQVIFTPHEWRYYYDTIKLFCGEHSENLVVPIHAYPSTNDIALPRIVDFGRVAISTPKTKAIPLSCKIPINFEFEITVLQAHPDFQIKPLSGTIPKDGSTEIVITFLPTKHRTARAEIEVNISQFDFEPVTISLVGNCVPDMTRDEVLERGRAELRAAAAQSSMNDSLMTKASTLKTKKGGPMEFKPPLFVVDGADRVIDGVKVPPRFDQQATNFMISQTAGKLPLKDLASFIREQREAADRRRRKAEASPVEGDEAAAREAEEEADPDSRQAMELRFEMQYREIEKYDKEKELKAGVASGEELLTEEEILREHDARSRKCNRQIEGIMQEGATRFESVLSDKQVAVPNTFRPALLPHWDENANDMFSMRLQVIDRFVRAGSKCLMRVRAQKNLERIRQALEEAGVHDRAECRAWVDAENKVAAASGRSATAATGTEGDDEDIFSMPVVEIPLDFVLPFQIPTDQSLMNTEDRQLVQVTPLSCFQEFHPVRINPRLDYKVLQYDRYAAPPPAAYMRPDDHRPRLHAALEELSVRGQRGDFLDGAEGHDEAEGDEGEPDVFKHTVLSMPACCTLPPQHDPLSLLVPSTECRTFVGFPDFAECDFEYRLSEPGPLLTPLTTEPLLPQDLLSLEQPWLDTWRRTRRLRDPFDHFDPFPGSFVEGGGPMGPRLGGDAGGERIAFLPVGGYGRDVPSDTDSDEREDFQMPVPGDEEHQKALQGMSRPLSSELWRKRRRAEERLQKQCDSNNRIVRERLRELNKDLDPKNKLFLG
mmetsp:Transcript_50838/g.94107  ORF Transcript_50838/g.94107 Transcript_50838/m.94107 type:complete len:874 (+) Transcript_50838:125-2746(+)